MLVHKHPEYIYEAIGCIYIYMLIHNLQMGHLLPVL